uniref:Odorant receptor coreceptor n=1 Tax=Cacopsylla melanoneura TaxID=428564 RepID=A0A8D9F8H1_9HEMI
MHKVNKHGLVGDLWPNIRLMHLTGMFILEFHEDSSPGTQMLRFAYCWIVTVLLLAQYAGLVVFVVGLNYSNDLLAGGVVTALFFAHGLFKYIYVGLKNKSFYRVLSSWNNANSHPVFSESNARYRARSLSRMKRVLTIICVWTSATIICWVTITLFYIFSYHIMLGDNHLVWPVRVPGPRS